MMQKPVKTENSRTIILDVQQLRLLGTPSRMVRAKVSDREGDMSRDL